MKKRKIYIPKPTRNPRPIPVIQNASETPGCSKEKEKYTSTARVEKPSTRGGKRFETEGERKEGCVEKTWLKAAPVGRMGIITPG